VFNNVCRDLGWQRGTDDITVLRERLAGENGRPAARVRDFRQHSRPMYDALLVQAGMAPQTQQRAAQPYRAPARPGVPGVFLDCLNLPALRDLCEAMGLNVGGRKDEVVNRLSQDGVTYDDLLIDDLKDILYQFDLFTTGNKPVLIARLQDFAARVGLSTSTRHAPIVMPAPLARPITNPTMHPAPAIPRRRPTIDNSAFIGGPITTAQYRASMERAGVPLRHDQHVSHIISEANGGANHSDNYFIASNAFNLGTGNRHDALIAYIAGLERADTAVEISRRLRGYNGPTAVQLFRQGEEVFRQVRRINRNAGN